MNREEIKSLIEEVTNETIIKLKKSRFDERK